MIRTNEVNVNGMATVSGDAELVGYLIIAAKC